METPKIFRFGSDDSLFFKQLALLRQGLLPLVDLIS